MERSTEPSSAATNSEESDLRESRRPVEKPPPDTKAQERSASVPLSAETETVPAVPALAVSAGPGSLRVRRSVESSKAKKKKRSKLNAGSKADMFAAKVASAVNEADSSGSDETFVYDAVVAAEQQPLRRPFTRTPSNLSLPMRNGLTPLQTGSSLQGSANMPLSQINTEPAVHHSYATMQSQNALAPKDPVPGSPWARQFLVSRAPALSPRESMRAKYLQRWKTSGLDEEDEDDGEGESGRGFDERSPLRGSIRPYRSSVRSSSGQSPYMHPSQSGLQQQPSQSQQQPQGGRRWYPQEYGPGVKVPPFYVRATLWTVLVLIALLAFTLVIGLWFAASRPLQGFHIAQVIDVLPSDRMLVFSLVARARNPGYLTISISDADLDVFARPTVDLSHVMGGAPHVFLGNISQLESPLVFSGGLFTPKQNWALAPVRLDYPCSNTSEPSEVWQNISSAPFQLGIRGVLIYNVLFQEVRAPVEANVWVGYS